MTEKRIAVYRRLFLAMSYGCCVTLLYSIAVWSSPSFLDLFQINALEGRELFDMTRGYSVAGSIGLLVGLLADVLYWKTGFTEKHADRIRKERDRVWNAHLEIGIWGLHPEYRTWVSWRIKNLSMRPVSKHLVHYHRFLLTTIPTPAVIYLILLHLF